MLGAPANTQRMTGELPEAVCLAPRCFLLVSLEKQTFGNHIQRMSRSSTAPDFSHLPGDLVCFFVFFFAFWLLCWSWVFYSLFYQSPSIIVTHCTFIPHCLFFLSLLCSHPQVLIYAPCYKQLHVQNHSLTTECLDVDSTCTPSDLFYANWWKPRVLQMDLI